ncbi:MAG: class I tRNA ligase family protein, partial [Chloroflexi bacterium]|nr:class I tRNA ligase family protein [Chloroflexota bacterium]
VSICPKCHSRAERDTDTLDNLVCSSWYFLRYTSPGVDDLPFDLDKSDYWLPADRYAAPADRATGHLLYARFFWKAIRDLGVVQGDEPFRHLTTPGPIATRSGTALDMAEWVREFGADAVRAYLLSLGPWEEGGIVGRDGVETTFGWLQKVHSLALSGGLPEVGDSAAEAELAHAARETTAAISAALEGLCPEQAVSTLRRFTERLGQALASGRVGRGYWRSAIRALLLMLAPIAPHLAEDLWEKTGHSFSIHSQPWPSPDIAS